MPVGLNVYDGNNNAGLYSKYQINQDHLTMGMEYNSLINDGDFDSLTAGGKLEFGAGSKDKDAHYSRIGIEGSIDYTTDISDVFTFGANANVQAGYGYLKSNRTKTKYDKESGYNYYKPSAHIKSGFYVSPTVGAEIGINDEYDGRAVVFGKAGRDIVKKENFQQVGVKYERPIGGAFGDATNATWSLAADYTFNNKNTTFNLNDRKGWGVSAGIQFTF